MCAMRLADEVMTLLKVPLSDQVVPRSEIVLAGQPTGTEVEGGALEAAVAVDGGHLVFLTEGVPEEERLSIYLVDPAGRLIDRADVGQWYTPAAFSDLAIEGADTLRFRFLGDGHWRLRMLSGSALRLPLVPEAPCVTRPFGFTRCFVLSTDSTRN